jgi:dihydroorotase
MRLGETITTPGFVDFHVHLRDPSTNNAETMYTGTNAAAEGGFVLVKDMPNNPGMPTWTVERMRKKHERINQDAVIYVGVAAGSQPESDNLGELEQMAAMALDLKLYGSPTQGNDNEYEAHDFESRVRLWHTYVPDKPIGFHSAPHNVEDMTYLVTKKYSQHLHLCHVSTDQEIDLLVRAKREGLPITGGVTAHHLLKSSFDVHSEGWFARMQPPLVEQAEAEKLMYYLAKGVIDIIETDHAPHTVASKMQAEAENPEGIHDTEHRTCFGVPGVEFTFPLLAYQALRGRITMERLVDAMSTQPARILGVHIARDTKTTWLMDEYRISEGLASRSSGSGWTPFMGKLAVGEMQTVAVRGKIIAATHNVPIDVLRGTRVVSERGITI